MSAKVICLTDKNFDQYFHSSKLLAIDFWAPWCEPCKDFDRLFNELAADFPTIVFATVNVDEEKKTCRRFFSKIRTNFGYYS